MNNWRLNPVVVLVIVVVFLLLFGGFFTTETAAQTINSTTLYVKPSGTGLCGGWLDACELQTAISNAKSGDQIWVAEGTYYPTKLGDGSISFELKDGVAIYGGFFGNETVVEQRDWVDNLTILSGDIGEPEDNIDNSMHVVTGDSIGATAILDGFTIRDGYWPFGFTGGAGVFLENADPTLSNLIITENHTYLWFGHGGGMYASNCSPILTKVQFIHNHAGNAGGGMYANNSSPQLTDVSFTNNSGGNGGGLSLDSDSNAILTGLTFTENTAIFGSGGALYIYQPPPDKIISLTNITFSSNSAALYGGAMYINSPLSANYSVQNATFSGNHADQSGGAIYLDLSFAGTLSNSILWGNAPDQIAYNDGNTHTLDTTNSIVQGGWEGTNILVVDPKLGPLADNGGPTQTHALMRGSPAIDALNPALCPSVDQRGVTRPIDGDADGIAKCDMGAYEAEEIKFIYLPLLSR